MEKSENTKEVKAKKREKQTKQKILSNGKNVIPFVTGFIHRSDSNVIVMFTYLPLTALCKLWMEAACGIYCGISGTRRNVYKW